VDNFLFNLFKVEIGTSWCHISRILFSKSSEEKEVLDLRIKFSANLFRVNLAGIVLRIFLLSVGVVVVGVYQ
jgi:hypothetical protein